MGRLLLLYLKFRIFKSKVLSKAAKSRGSIVEKSKTFRIDRGIAYITDFNDSLCCIRVYNRQPEASHGQK
jgi:hypothetical protein